MSLRECLPPASHQVSVPLRESPGAGAETRESEYRAH
jgi:hypothetical protein